MVLWILIHDNMMYLETVATDKEIYGKSCFFSDLLNIYFCVIFPVNIFKGFFFFLSEFYTQCGAQIHDLEIESHALPTDLARHLKDELVIKNKLVLERLGGLSH